MYFTVFVFHFSSFCLIGYVLENNTLFLVVKTMAFAIIIFYYFGTKTHEYFIRNRIKY